MKRIKGEDQGSLLLGALIISLLLSYFATSIYLHSRDVITLRQAEVHAVTASSRSRWLTLKELKQDTLNTQGVRCEGQAAETGRHSISHSLCIAEYHTEAVSLSPVAIDYNQFFDIFTPCIKQAELLSSDIFPLEPQSNASALSCIEVAPDEVNIIINGNLRLADFGSGETCKFLTLAATGFLHIEKLDISCDTLIVAGGDIFIEDINAIAESSIKVSLVSGSGAILAPYASGAIELAAFSSGSILLAPSSLQKEPYLLPPLLKKEVLGFIE